jgi:hypothetical protein
MAKSMGTPRWDAIAGVLAATAAAIGVGLSGKVTLVLAWYDLTTWLVWRGGW